MSNPRPQCDPQGQTIGARGCIWGTQDGVQRATSWARLLSSSRVLIHICKHVIDMEPARKSECTRSAHRQQPAADSALFGSNQHTLQFPDGLMGDPRLDPTQFVAALVHG